MRITIAQGPFLPVPPLLGGAIEKFFFPLAQLWASAGHQVTHISRSYPGLAEHEVIGGVSHLRIPSRGSSPLASVNKLLDFAFAARVTRALPPADILVSNTFFLPVLARAQSRTGHLYIHAARYPRGQMSLYRHAARLQVPSQAIAEAISEQSPSVSERISVIPYALAELPHPFPQPIPAGPLRLLYVGRLHREKGVHLLLQALALLPAEIQAAFTMTLVGPHANSQGGSGEAYLSELRLQASGLTTPVTFSGPIFSAAELAACYSKAQLFVYPSLADRGETFGVAPLEALSHGLPVLASALPCFKDFLNENNSIVFNHRSPAPANALASSLRHALSLLDRWPALSNAAFETASRYTLSSVSQLMLTDFGKILEEQK